MKTMRLKATLPSKALLGADENGNPRRFDMFYSVSNWAEPGDDLAAIFGPDWLERLNKYEDAHNTKGAARRRGQLAVDAAEAAARKIAPGFTATDAAEAIMENAEDYGKIPGDRKTATPEELGELTEWVILQLSEEPTFAFGAPATMSDALARKAQEMQGVYATLNAEGIAALVSGMTRRGFTAWHPSATPEPTLEQCAQWLTFRARYDAAQAKSDPLAALA